jgi:hypothetical protein
MHVFVQGNFKYENFKGSANAMHRIVDEQFKGPIWAEQIWAIYDGTGKFGEWEFCAQIIWEQILCGAPGEICRESDPR